MEQHERHTTPSEPDVLPGTSPDRLDETRAEANRLLRAADEAIARALSADSQAFLQANRQTVGQ
jgi:hypothetical protein